MDSFKEIYSADMRRYKGDNRFQKKYIYFLRRFQSSCNQVLKMYYHLRFKILSEKHAMEIDPRGTIGKGLYIGHPYNITINSAAVIGENCNIHKGVLIGGENRGRRSGAPVIGSNVWIGINSAIVGNVHIGDDVLIAPNAFINCDVPAHSVVFGNPCIIKHKENATEGYINNRV